jgi:hypothetical protein
MQHWAVNILFYCSLTKHVLGALAPIIRSTGNCIYSHRYRVYTDKMDVVEGKTVKNITLNLQLPYSSVAELAASCSSSTLHTEHTVCASAVRTTARQHLGCIKRQAVKKNTVYRSWRWAKNCPKHVELVECQYIIIVTSSWSPTLFHI